VNAHLAFKGYGDKRLHLGLAGSIAAYKSLELVRLWQAAGLGLDATLTKSAVEFVGPLSFEALGCERVHTDMYAERHGAFDHLEPAQSADAYVVAPATANTLAKLAHGIADDTLSCQCLAFEGPLVLAPAMNPRMWKAAAVQENWKILKDRGVLCIEPECGTMACGEEGRGRLAAVETIYLHGLKAVTPRDMAGKKVLVTLGPTREPWDCVRFWSNPSTGIMGAAVAVSAWLRGAEVVAVCGPVDVWLPEAIQRIDVATAAQMYDACVEFWPTADMACMTAAVADYTPKEHPEGKYKKDKDDELVIAFKRSKDIAAELGKQKRTGQILIGFAAESDAPRDAALAKLNKKHMDLIIGNNVTETGCGFASHTNRVTVIDRHGREEHWPLLPKTEVAWRIWEWALTFLA
jgi:phosphopantothenoylcysteine decarboxylase/phosphopantothenate--cysteine ligase